MRRRVALRYTFGMPRIYHNRIVVNEDAIDINHHVNNLAYLRWMQEIATEHSAAQGWPFDRYVALGSGWFVRSHTIEYLHPAFADDTLLSCTWVHDMASRSSQRRHCFVRESDHEVIARAETNWVFVNFKTGRPVRLPAEVASAFVTVPDDDAELLSLTIKPFRL